MVFINLLSCLYKTGFVTKTNLLKAILASPQFRAVEGDPHMVQTGREEMYPKRGTHVQRYEEVKELWDDR